MLEDRIMDLMQKSIPLPVDLDIAKVRDWVVWLTEVERHLGSYFSRYDARRRAWAYVAGCSAPSSAKTAGR